MDEVTDGLRRQRRVFVSYPAPDEAVVREIVAELESSGIRRVLGRHPDTFGPREIGEHTQTGLAEPCAQALDESFQCLDVVHGTQWISEKDRAGHLVPESLGRATTSTDRSVGRGSRRTHLPRRWAA